MNTSVPGTEDLGPFELLYLSVEHIFNLTQRSIHLDKISDFIDSVRWREPFIQALLAFQLLLFLLAYVTRKRDFIQFGILLVVTMIALCAEKLNDYGKRHWSKFATQDYFDRNGLFMMTFLSGPFVVLANFIVIGMGLRLVKLYARKKQRDLRAHRRQGSQSTPGGRKKEQ